MIFIDDGSHKEEAYGLWQRNFHDPLLYATNYFNTVYGNNLVFFFSDEEEGETVYKGMLHMNPYTLHVGGQDILAHYIVGVSTDEAYRRQGVMRQLLKVSLTCLRDQGEAFTYLMPADEAYYLPFDFRFGMEQVEQEIEYLGTEASLLEESLKLTAEEPLDESQEQAEHKVDLCGVADSFKESWRFVRYDCHKEEQNLDLSIISELEDTSSAETFALFTKISPEYLKRLGKEVESDYAHLIYIYEGEQYLGRFCLSEEAGYLVVYQVVCLDRARRKEFLQKLFSYCSLAYHESRFQITFDETWKDDLYPLGKHGNLRCLPVKVRKKIMFRILDLTAMSSYLSCQQEEEEIHTFYVEDPFLKGNTGFYQCRLKDGRVLIEKYQKIGSFCADNLSYVTIAELTEVLFGNQTPQEVAWSHPISDNAKAFLAKIKPIRKTNIAEFV